MSAAGLPIGRRRLLLGLSALVTTLAALAAAAPVAGQSMLAREGLGLPVPPLDARSRALGSAGVGLSGWHLGATDPSAAAGLVLPSITVSLQPVQTTLQDGQDAGRTRFPVVGISYPYGENVFSVRLGSFLDQEWEDRTERTIMLEGEEVLARDRFTSSGGIGQVRVGWARRLGASLAVGVSAGSYLGTVERRFSRSLAGESVVRGVEPFLVQGRWRASGPAADVGVTWDPSSLLRVSAVLAWSGDLELSPVAGGVTEERKYSMPLELRGGGTFTLTPGLGLAMSATFADWSSTGRDVTGTDARGSAWSYGAGLEWSQASLRERPFPIRVGIREAQLPFPLDGANASERTYSGGVGLHLAETETVPLARFELGLERGERTAGPVSESFWRTTVSVRLAGG